jgi:hypothetical protein
VEQVLHLPLLAQEFFTLVVVVAAVIAELLVAWALLAVALVVAPLCHLHQA